jgi:hypothetical protein
VGPGPRVRPRRRGAAGGQRAGRARRAGRVREVRFGLGVWGGEGLFVGRRAGRARGRWPNTPPPPPPTRQTPPKTRPHPPLQNNAA